MSESKQQHWEKVYATKTDQEVSWYQEVPETSLKLIQEFNTGKGAAIIDIGGGNSNLSAQLLQRGYGNLTVLDISSKALDRTKGKLGNAANNITWVASDVLAFAPHKPFDVWHDRATFHFLTEQTDMDAYVALVEGAITSGGYLILATFSTTGPEKCSGLHITQYSAQALETLFANNFQMVKHLQETHQTPFNTQQDFVYVVFKHVGQWQFAWASATIAPVPCAFPCHGLRSGRLPYTYPHPTHTMV